MKSFFQNIKKRYKKAFLKPGYTRILILSIVLFIISIHTSLAFSEYNDIWNNGKPLDDFLHSLIPILDLSPIFIFGGFIILFFGVLYSTIRVPEKAPLTLLAFSILLLIRSITINVTYIAIPEEHIFPSTYGIEILSFQGDLFFSGHTAVPFLGALILWEQKIIRYILLLSSVIMAFTVLSMRLHYTIDVIGAYFITYGVYHIALEANNAAFKFFKKNKAIKK